MKKIILLTLVLSLVASFSFAQFPGESYKQVTGKVKTLTIGAPSRIVVVDDQSVEMALVIDPEATFYDAEFYPVTLDAVKVNDRVNIRYNTTDNGTNEATWFNILSS